MKRRNFPWASLLLISTVAFGTLAPARESTGFAAPDPHWAYSAGFGLGLKMLSINAALVFSTEGGTSLSSTNRRDLGGSLDARFRF